jgi:hypothetical protein
MALAGRQPRQALTVALGAAATRPSEAVRLVGPEAARTAVAIATLEAAAVHQRAAPAVRQGVKVLRGNLRAGPAAQR